MTQQPVPKPVKHPGDRTEPFRRTTDFPVGKSRPVENRRYKYR